MSFISPAAGYPAQFNSYSYNPTAAAGGVAAPLNGDAAGSANGTTEPTTYDNSVISAPPPEVEAPGKRLIGMQQDQGIVALGALAAAGTVVGSLLFAAYRPRGWARQGENYAQCEPDPRPSKVEYREQLQEKFANFPPFYQPVTTSSPATTAIQDPLSAPEPDGLPATNPININSNFRAGEAEPQKPPADNPLKSLPFIGPSSDPSVPNVPDEPDVPEVQNAPDAPDAPNAPNAPNAPDASDAPGDKPPMAARTKSSTIMEPSLSAGSLSQSRALQASSSTATLRATPTRVKSPVLSSIPEEMDTAASSGSTSSAGGGSDRAGSAGVISSLGSDDSARSLEEANSGSGLPEATSSNSDLDTTMHPATDRRAQIQPELNAHVAVPAAAEIAAPSLQIAGSHRRRYSSPLRRLPRL